MADTNKAKIVKSHGPLLNKVKTAEADSVSLLVGNPSITSSSCSAGKRSITREHFFSGFVPGTSLV